jgi:hypothetical protein
MSEEPESQAAIEWGAIVFLAALAVAQLVILFAMLGGASS